MHDDTLVVQRRYAASRSPRDLELLVVRYRGLAGALTRRYTRPGLPAEDLEQVASLGLVKAIQRFDPDRGCAFSTFAVPTILGELRQFCRSVLWPVRVPRLVQERMAAVRRATNETVAACGRAPTVRELAARFQCDEGDVVDALHAQRCLTVRSLDSDPGADDHEPPDDRERWLATEELGFETVEERSALKATLGRLTDAERELVRLRFVEELSHREIAARLEISASQVGRMLAGAVDRLAEDAEPPTRPSVAACRRRVRRAPMRQVAA